MQMDFAGTADLDAMADLLGELFALEADFAADRDNAAALPFYDRLAFEKSAMVVRRIRLLGSATASP